jgi:hypothetical protein
MSCEPQEGSGGRTASRSHLATAVAIEAAIVDASW